MSKVINLCAEQWRWIPGYEGYYKISNMGRTLSAARTNVDKTGRSFTVRERVLKTIQTIRYRTVSQHRDNHKHTAAIHKLVGRAFLTPPTNPTYEICHRNNIKHDCRASNLYWGSRKHNIRDARDKGLRIENTHQRITLPQANQIKHMLKTTNLTQVEVAKQIGVTYAIVHSIKVGRTWESSQVA